MTTLLPIFADIALMFEQVKESGICKTGSVLKGLSPEYNQSVRSKPTLHAKRGQSRLAMGVADARYAVWLSILLMWLISKITEPVGMIGGGG
jgi:hypothetical protein